MVCAGCSAPETDWTDAAARPEAFGGQAQPTRRQERFARIERANHVLRHYGLKLGDFEGQLYVLGSATGRQELVPHLPGMWAAAERLAGRAVLSPSIPV